MACSLPEHKGRVTGTADLGGGVLKAPEGPCERQKDFPPPLASTPLTSQMLWLLVLSPPLPAVSSAPTLWVQASPDSGSLTFGLLICHPQQRPAVLLEASPTTASVWASWSSEPCLRGSFTPTPQLSFPSAHSPVSRPEASLHLPASPNPPSTLTVPVLLFHVRVIEAQ